MLRHRHAAPLALATLLALPAAAQDAPAPRDAAPPAAGASPPAERAEGATAKPASNGPLPRGAVLEEVSGTVVELDGTKHRLVIDTGGGQQVTLRLDRNSLVYGPKGLTTVLDVTPGAQVRAARNADFQAYWVQLRSPSRTQQPTTPGQGTGPGGGAGAPAEGGPAAPSSPGTAVGPGSTAPGGPAAGVGGSPAGGAGR